MLTTTDISLAVVVGIITIIVAIYKLRHHLFQPLVRVDHADALKTTTEIAMSLKLADEVNRQTIADLTKKVEEANIKVDAATKEIKTLQNKIDDMQRLYAEDSYSLMSAIKTQERTIAERDATIATQADEIAALQSQLAARTARRPRKIAP